MSIIVTATTILPTARPWKFAAIASSAGSATAHAGYNANKTDGSGAGGSSGLNSAYAYGQQHGTAGETNPHVFAVTPGAFVSILWTSGTAKADSGSTLYGPHGNTAGTTGLSPTADYTDSNGYVHPTNCMPASKNLSLANPTIGRMGLCGCFTDGVGSIIPKSFWDFRSKPILEFIFLSCNNAAGGNTVYNGSASTPFPAYGLVGLKVIVSGFSAHAVNNGIFTIVASAATTLTLNNSGGIAETHAAVGLLDRIAFYAPTDPTTAYLSMGINDTVLYDNGGTGFSVTVGVYDAMTVALQGDPPAFKRYPFWVANCTFPDSFYQNIFMSTTFTPQYDFSVNGFNKEHTGQLYPSGPPIRGSGQVYP